MAIGVDFYSDYVHTSHDANSVVRPLLTGLASDIFLPWTNVGTMPWHTERIKDTSGHPEANRQEQEILSTIMGHVLRQLDISTGTGLVTQSMTGDDRECPRFAGDAPLHAT